LNFSNDSGDIRKALFIYTYAYQMLIQDMYSCFSKHKQTMIIYMFIPKALKSQKEMKK